MSKDIQVRMKSVMAGPDGTHHIGSTPTFPAAKANELIKGGYAEAIDPAPAARKQATSKKLSDDEVANRKAALEKLTTELAALTDKLAAADDADKESVQGEINAKQVEIDALTE